MRGGTELHTFAAFRLLCAHAARISNIQFGFKPVFAAQGVNGGRMQQGLPLEVIRPKADHLV
ncbi:hypothetical protein RA25_17160 [Leisingera sp. ANG-S5]|nr:hypothetical protein RA25_17160 [Leisingera sp. ANG-S5]